MAVIWRTSGRNPTERSILVTNGKEQWSHTPVPNFSEASIAIGVLIIAPNYPRKGETKNPGWKKPIFRGLLGSWKEKMLIQFWIRSFYMSAPCHWHSGEKVSEMPIMREAQAPHCKEQVLLTEAIFAHSQIPVRMSWLTPSTEIMAFGIPFPCKSLTMPLMPRWTYSKCETQWITSQF